MQWKQLPTEWARRYATNLSRSPSLPAFAVGVLVGLLAVSTSLPWLLTWGEQPEFVSAAFLLCGLGLLASHSIRVSKSFSASQLGVVACCGTLLQPVLLASLTASLGFVPVSAMESIAVRSLIALICAVPVWFVAALLWSRVIAVGIALSKKRGGLDEKISFAVCLGISCGIALNAFCLSNFVGSWLAVIFALVATIACGGRGLREQANPVEASDVTAIRSTNLNGSANTSAIAALLLGGLFATTTRLLGQLMPGGFQVGCAEWIGLFLGCGGVGLYASSRTRTVGSAGGAWLFAAAWSALLLAAFPLLIEGELWMNASLTWVATLLTARTALLILAIVPLGIALAGAVASNGNSKGDLMSSVAGCGLSFIFGMVLAYRSIPDWGLVWPLGLSSVLLVVLALFDRVRLHAAIPLSLRGVCVWACLALAGISVPLWQSHNDAAKVAKLLFSTPAFLAHRSGWESSLLPMLDDTRLVFRTEGSRGPLTLWRSRGLELQLRENGVPRAVVSVNADVQPQFAPEVLLATLPLILSDHPGRVLLLGASGGVPLSTCLHFPVREAVCVEADAALIDLVRGPLANETGFDPFRDDRVRRIAAPPELALMASDAPFDVILSSPPSSAIVGGGASFTAEYYRRVSHRLAERGLFCQRFECLDYGPGPLRRVVQSMRQAFREVIAVETAAGELLLLATNSGGVFIPDDLPARLEAPHVRKLLARSGLDWSTPLNYPTYDHAALGEICDEVYTWSNSTANGLLAVQAPLDLMRWGAKLQESQKVLTAIRTTPAPFWNRDAGDQPTLLEGEVKLSRKSRFLEWLGDSRVSPELLRRLAEVVTQQKLVREFPEEHWWKYRAALRDQLQNHPRSAIQQVKHVRGPKPAHPEDVARKAYFEAFGEAAQRAKPSGMQIAAMEACLEPYDPLLSFFGRQEVADLLARSDSDPASELAHRLHVIYFAPPGEASTRNVAAAIELLVRHPEAIPDDARRFDVLNGLIQLLRTRWESRQNTPGLTVARQLTDVDRSVVAIEKGLAAMEPLVTATNLTQAEWTTRQAVVDRILLRPLRSYRSSLQAQMKKSESHTRAILEQAAEAKSE